MNREPLLHVLAIAETCRSGSVFMNKCNLLVMNLFMKNLLLLSVLQPTNSGKANTVVGFLPYKELFDMLHSFIKSFMFGIIFTLYTSAPGFCKHSFS